MAPPGASYSYTSFAPLGASHMSQPGTDQHQSGVTVREAYNHTSAAADLPVQPFNHIIGADASPVLSGEIAVGQRFLHSIFYLLSGLFQLHAAKFFHHRLSLFPCSFLALLSVEGLENFGDQIHLGARCDREHVTVKVDGTTLVLGLRKHFSHSLQHTRALVSPAMSFTPSRPQPQSH